MIKNFIQKYIKFLGMEIKKKLNSITFHIFQAIDGNYHFDVLRK